MTFRKDINGLRAFAVLAVVLFHFDVAGFNGGFAGVDIFFVISGYLMTRIIFGKINQSQFSLIDFYLHRARRIIPALAILCVFMIIFGFFCLLTSEFREVMRNIKSVIQFTSNLKFYDSFGYFDTSSKANWLLHTWSLSVEWQFYLLYPLVILCFRKLWSEFVVKIIVLYAGLSSLVFCIFYTSIDPSGAYFFLTARAWEMLAGGIVYLFPLSIPPKLKTPLAYLGLTSLVIIFITINETVAWPSFWAVLPIMATMIVLWANKTPNYLLDDKFSQWLGTTSYSVYLWHWPISVFLYNSDLLHTPIAKISGIVLALIMGSLSYILIERRITLKYKRSVEITRYLLIILVITAIAAALASLVKKYPDIRTGPLFSKSFQEIEYLANTHHPYSDQCLHMNDMETFPECKIGKGEPSLIVFGDSHANASFSAVQEANTKGSTILWSFMGCPILDTVKFSISRREGCVHLIQEKLTLLDNAYDDVPVLMINRLFNIFGNDKVSPQIYFDTPLKQPTPQLYEQFRSSYLRTLCRIAKRRPVYVLKPIPEPGYNVPKKMAMDLITETTPADLKSTSLDNYQSLNHFVLDVMEEAKEQCGVTLLDPIPYLCPQGQCIASKEGKPLYFDDNHLTEYGNKFLLPLFKRLFIQNNQ